MPYAIEGGLITGPQQGQCAGYIMNFTGHGAYDPTGKIKVGDLELTQEQVDTHNKILAKAEVDAMIKSGKGMLYLSYDAPKCTPDHPRWVHERNGTWRYTNYRVTSWSGEFKVKPVHVRHGWSYGYCRAETHWIWFTGPDGEQWYGVQKGFGRNFHARRLKHQKHN